MAATEPPGPQSMVESLVESLCAELPPAATPPHVFWGAQFDRGLAWPTFPLGRGGLAVTPREAMVVTDALRDQAAPLNAPRNPVGVGMVAQVLIAFGSQAQCERLLRPMFTCEEIWCQLFSEPGAGSDLAGLATTAVRDGDEWVLNGQKVWTTFAHLARWGLIVVRTDVNVPKHQGLTCFVVDMRAAGIEVRQLRQMTGDDEFNEVFLTDVRVRDSDRLGDVGQGWQVALATLMNERVALAERSSTLGGVSLSRALNQWQAATEHPAHLRARLASLYVESECLRLTKARAAAARRRGTPGPEGSVAKALSGRLSQRVAEFCVDLAGASGMLVHSYDSAEVLAARKMGDPATVFLRSRANTIEGGTTEVLKQIVGERVLGLPPDSRTDRELPWKDVPRN